MENEFSERIKSRMKQDISDARWQFEMAVEAAACEVTEIAKDISKAIGDVSVSEAKAAIVEEFRKRLG